MPASGRDASDLHLMVGQLIEMGQSSTKHIEKLIAETRATSETLAVVDNTLGRVESLVKELDTVVRSGNGLSLVTQMQTVRIEIKNLRADLDRAEETAKSAADALGALEIDANHRDGGHRAAAWIVGVLGWFITTAVAVYAAVKAK